MSHVATQPVDPPHRTWLSRAWSRVAGVPHVAVYAFGKHPAFDDFIDVAKLPRVPDAFRRFHDVLRPAVERDGGPEGPLLIAWRERGVSSVLWAQPSRDRGDAVTGRFRRCPLLLGTTAAVPLAELLRFAGGRLVGLADGVATADAGGVFRQINAAAGEWAQAFPSSREPGGELPIASLDIPAGDTVVVVAGEADRFAEGIAMSAATAAMLGAWIARAAGGPPMTSVA